MRKWRWMLVLLGVVCTISANSTAEDISLHFSGHLTAGQGTCQQISDSQISCQVSPGSSAILELTAAVSPPEYGVTIDAWDLPPWVSFAPVSGYGTVSTLATINAPDVATGFHDPIVTLVFTAATAYELQIQLEVELVITEPAPPTDGELGSTYDGPASQPLAYGEETDQGIEFEIPFLPDFSTFVLGEVTDCETGDPIDASDLSTEFIFSPTAQPPYELTELAKVIVRSPGYSPYEITEFQPHSISFLFLRITLLTPADPNICLEPIGETAPATAEVLGQFGGSVTTSIAPRLLPIDLASPVPGEGIGAPSSAVQFCWESLGIPGLTYEVLHYTKQCDPDVVNGPHPFAPLIPDPTLPERRRALTYERKNFENDLAALREYCANLQKTFGQAEQRLAEIPGALRRLEDGRDEADAAQRDTEEKPFELPLPTRCPRSAEMLFAPHAALLDATQVEPCDPDACRELSNHLWHIVDTIQSLGAVSVGQGNGFERLRDRWVNGADHRGTMELYHGLFSLVDKVIGLVTELIGLLTPDAEEIIQGLIEEYVTDAVCLRSPELCEAIDKGKNIRDQLDIIQSILESARDNGTPGPAFLVQMVQAMAQQASRATGVAVKGWANFAEYMASVLWDAYESLLCEEQAIQWLLSRRAQIEAICEACQRCLAAEINEVDAELAGIAVEMEQATEARVAYWQEQCSAISSQISQVGAYLDPAWYDACCGQNPQTINIPSESLCAQQLEEALKQALGDKACFLTFSCTIKCEYENGQPVAATVECEHSFPLAERRPCCCAPCERQQSSLGTQADPGRPGGTICHPPEGGVPAPEPGSWGVEARDESGNLVASSPRRELGRGVISEPSTLRPEPVPSGCLCSISGSVNGIPMTPGGFALTMQQGVQVNISAVGDCGPTCDAGTQSISIQPPIVAPAWLANPIALMPTPISVAGSSTAYDFPSKGTYAITVSQFCEDGQACSYTFSVDASEPPSPVPRQPRIGEETMPGTCPGCRNDECIGLAYQYGEEPPLIPLSGHMLKLASPSTLVLEATSSCRLDCVGGRNVRWEMNEPDGDQEIFEGVDSYRTSYLFEELGKYSLCVIETVPCPGRELRFENWWIFQVESSD